MTPFYKKNRLELLKYIGNIRQIAGAKRYFIADGRGCGVECVDVRTGTGFEYTVMPGRGMDIYWCGYKGIPISYISKVGISSPSFFSGVKDQWRQCFPGGMLSTCGLGNVGSFCSDDNLGIGVQDFGQHGRISNLCAENISVKEKWQGEDAFYITIEGTLREAQLRAENYTLHRTVSSALGENCIHIYDTITNEDFLDRPCLFLYHVNFGYPVVDAGAKILIDKQATLINGLNEAHVKDHDIIHSPKHGEKEKLYFYQFNSPGDLYMAAIYNPEIELLSYVSFKTDGNRAYLTEWKMLAESDYVVGLEFGNCIPKGRGFLKDHDMLFTLQGFASVSNTLEIGVVEGNEDIYRFAERYDLNI